VEGGIMYAGNYLIEAVDKSRYSYYIESDTRFIGPLAFQGCTYMSEISIPSSVIQIADNAFKGCENLPIYNGARYAGDCLITAIYSSSYHIEPYTRFILGGAFYGCDIANIKIPDSIISIGDSAFQESSLNYIHISDNVTTVGSYAFADCKQLKIAIIGSSVTSIGDKAFANCNSLKEIYCKAKTPPTIEDIFGDTIPECKIVVPYSSVQAYQKAKGWKEHADKIVGGEF
jgi:hypothetical protein